MRVAIEGCCLRRYIAKCHEAFRTGLRAMFDTRLFGKGYPGYRPWVRTYSQIIDRLFPECRPDILIADSYFPYDKNGFKYSGMAELNAPTTFILGDYWDIVDKQRDDFVRFVEDNRISYVLTYFPQPLDTLADTSLAGRLIYIPPCFDPAIFNDWQMAKQYDVGFLAAGTTDRHDFYPERFSIHHKLLKQANINYLWSHHPGWGQFSTKHPSVGQGFSKKINSCKMFVTTGGIFRNAHAKYVEILASRTLLLADEPIGWEHIGLQDGFNYVKISEEDVLDKIHYYLSRPEEAEEIATNGYATALKRHSCYQRAVEFHDGIATLNRDVSL